MERRSNPGSPWEQMSPAQTSDRLPQPTAWLKVLCRAGGGHYCWPSCTGGGMEGELRGCRARLSALTLSHSLPPLAGPFSSAEMQQVTFLLKPLTQCVFFSANLQQINCGPFGYWGVKWHGRGRQIVQIGGNMTTLTLTVNASESFLTETDTAQADPTEVRSAETQTLFSLWHIGAIIYISLLMLISSENYTSENHPSFTLELRLPLHNTGL